MNVLLCVFVFFTFAVFIVSLTVFLSKFVVFGNLFVSVERLIAVYFWDCLFHDGFSSYVSVVISLLSS